MMFNMRKISSRASYLEVAEHSAKVCISLGSPKDAERVIIKAVLFFGIALIYNWKLNSDQLQGFEALCRLYDKTYH
jgi:hypothetical protein